MLKPDAITTFTNFLKEQAALIGAVDGFEVRGFGPKTGIVDFTGQVTQEQAERLTEVLSRHPSVDHDPDATCWLDEYLEATDQDPVEDAEMSFIFDVADPEMIVFTPEEIAEHRKDYVIPIEDKWRNGPTNVYLPLRFQFFDDIVSGYKTLECRTYTPNWVKRLLGPQIKTITFQRGYAPGAKKIVVEVTGIELEDEDEQTRYAPDAIPDMATPALILIHLGKIVG